MGAEEAEMEGEEPVGGRKHVGTEVVEVERGGREYVSGAPAETTEGEREREVRNQKKRRGATREMGREKMGQWREREAQKENEEA